VNWRYQNTVLAVAVLANFTQQGTRLLISPMVPNIIDAFGTSKSAMGVALTGMWAAYAVFQYPSGVFGDEYGERTVIVVSLALTGAGSVLLGLAPSFLLFSLFAILLGAGTGLYFTAATSLLTTLFEETGQALSFHSAGISLSGLVAPAAAGYVGLSFGWRPAVVMSALLAFPLVVLTRRYVRPLEVTSPARSVREQFDLRGIRGRIVRPEVAFMTVLAAGAVFVNQAFMSFFPTFLVEYHRISPGTAGVAFGVVFLVSSLIQPVMGRLSDRTSRTAVVALSLALTGLGFTLALVSRSLVGMMLALGVLGLGLSWAGVFHAWFMDVLVGPAKGTDFGFVRTVYMFLGASGSVVTGTLADTAGWPAAYGVVVVLLAAGVAALLARRGIGLARGTPS